MSQPTTPEALARRFVTLPLSELQPNNGQIDGLPANPRTITADKLERLKRDIEQYPELLELRGLLVYPYEGKYVIIGGNMRYAALTQLGYRQAPCVIIPADTSADRLRAYTILDNAPFGQWDWDALANEWDEAQLPEWGVDLPFLGDYKDGSDGGEGGNGDGNGEGDGKDNGRYVRTVESPVYEITGKCPDVSELFDTAETERLIERIAGCKELTDGEREAFTEAAHRFTRFDYAKMAEYYAHASEPVQGVMEDLALVIIDFGKAIERGFVKLTAEMDRLNQLDKSYRDSHADETDDDNDDDK